MRFLIFFVNQGGSLSSTVNVLRGIRLDRVELEIIFRSIRPEVFCKKGALRNFTKFTGKHLCQSLSFNKVAGPATLLKERL